jgi:MerR family transcriptional regulator, repressor of the yfmOP operon
MTADTMSIGDAAQEAGVTTRTLRYYEQLGLLPPATRSVGGARRYTGADVERVARIRRLQDLLGHDLDQIRRVLVAEDRLAALRAEWQGDASAERREEILTEATEINNELRAQVRARLAALGDFAEELEETAKRYRKVARELRSTTGRRAPSAPASGPSGATSR